MHFLSQARKVEEMHPEKISYTSGKRNPEKKLYFSQKKAVLMFWENGNRKELFTFQKTELCELKKNEKSHP